MDYLKEMLSIVNKNKTKHIEVLGQDQAKERKLYQLYDGIINGDYKSDGQACRQLYGTNDLSKGYRNLKSRLEKRALNSLFFIDVNSSSFSDSQKAFYNCYKNLAAVKFLLGRGARKSSMKLAEKTLKQSLNYDLHDVSIPLLKDLRVYYGTLVGDQKKMKKYNKLLRQLLADNRYEERAREMYDTLASQFVHSKTIKPFHVKMAKEYSEELEEYLDKTSYSNFHFYAHLILVLRYEIENDYKKAVNACDRALSYLEKIERYKINHKFTFLFKKFTSLIQIKQYKEADEHAQQCFNFVDEGSFNWFLTAQFYIVLLFHSAKTQEAFDFYRRVKAIRKKKKIRSDVKEEFWNIIEAFIDYFITVGKIQLPAHKRRPRFDSETFIKSVPAFAKDKRGMNVTILVLQILFFLNENDTNEVINRTETLKTYTTRYLRNDANFRSNCFIKMLSKISEANFNRIALRRRTDITFESLKSKPLEITNQPVETEIVPFEVLWDLILASLDSTKPIKSKRRG